MESKEPLVIQLQDIRAEHFCKLIKIISATIEKIDPPINGLQILHIYTTERSISLDGFFNRSIRVKLTGDLINCMPLNDYLKQFNSIEVVGILDHDVSEGKSTVIDNKYWFIKAEKIIFLNHNGDISKIFTTNMDKTVIESQRVNIPIINKNEPPQMSIVKTLPIIIYTYFIRDSNSGLIKIGKSNNPDRRLPEICRGFPRQILDITPILIIEGDREAEFHERFKSARKENTEWFECSKSLLNFIFETLYKKNSFNQ